MNYFLKFQDFLKLIRFIRAFIKRYDTILNSPTYDIYKVCKSVQLFSETIQLVSEPSTSKQSEPRTQLSQESRTLSQLNEESDEAVEVVEKINEGMSLSIN